MTHKPHDKFPVLKILSKNLSEDLHILSSKNDELLILIYNNIDQEFPELVLGQELLMDTIMFEKYIPFNKQIDLNDRLFLVLLELDTEKGMEDLEPLINQNLESILNAYQQDNDSEISKILGDDDLLSISKLSYKNLLTKGLIIQGIHLFDAYYYQLEIK